MTSFLDETMKSIAAGICTIWEASVDTPAVYAEQCRVQDVDFEHSLLVRTEDGAFVGIGVLCRRGTGGFVLDFGIAPAFRRQGYGHSVFAALMDRVQDAGLTHIQLVVDMDNVAAQRIYQEAGFSRTRTLVTLQRQCADMNPGVTVEVCAPFDRLICHWAQVASANGGYSCWERELPSLLAMSGTRAFETPRGFVVVRRSAYFRRIDVVQLVLAPEADAHELEMLLCAASLAHDHRFPVAVPEEPVDSVLARQLISLRFRATDRVYEMQWET